MSVGVIETWFYILFRFCIGVKQIRSSANIYLQFICVCDITHMNDAFLGNILSGTILLGRMQSLVQNAEFGLFIFGFYMYNVEKLSPLLIKKGEDKHWNGNFFSLLTQIQKKRKSESMRVKQKKVGRINFYSHSASSLYISITS